MLNHTWTKHLLKQCSAGGQTATMRPKELIQVVAGPAPLEVFWGLSLAPPGVCVCVCVGSVHWLLKAPGHIVLFTASFVRSPSSASDPPASFLQRPCSHLGPPG
jgi:hypothetical protein